MPQTGDVDGSLPSAWYSTEDEKSLHEFYATADVVVSTLPGESGLDSRDTVCSLEHEQRG